MREDDVGYPSKFFSFFSKKRLFNDFFRDHRFLFTDQNRFYRPMDHISSSLMTRKRPVYGSIRRSKRPKRREQTQKISSLHWLTCCSALTNTYTPHNSFKYPTRKISMPQLAFSLNSSVSLLTWLGSVLDPRDLFIHNFWVVDFEIFGLKDIFDYFIFLC